MRNATASPVTTLQSASLTVTQHAFGGLRRGKARRRTRHASSGARRQCDRGRSNPQPENSGELRIIGAVVGGIGMALHEEAVIDDCYGRVINHNFAEYHVPVHVDVPHIEVIFVDEREEYLNPLGVKGVGEIGIVGAAAAIANAAFHATGVRVRDLPITIDKILGLRQAHGGSLKR